MPTPSTPEAFLEAMHALKGRACWAAFYGPSTGRTIQLHFEPKLRRAEILRNPALTDDERRFDGEFALFVACSWMLRWEGEIDFRSDEAFSDPVGLGRQVDRLVGRAVVGVEVREPSWDAALEFTGSLSLLLIADEDKDNYAVITREHVYAVWAQGRLTVEPRERD